MSPSQLTHQPPLGEKQQKPQAYIYKNDKEETQSKMHMSQWQKIVKKMGQCTHNFNSEIFSPPKIQKQITQKR